MELYYQAESRSAGMINSKQNLKKKKQEDWNLKLRFFLMTRIVMSFSGAEIP